MSEQEEEIYCQPGEIGEEVAESVDEGMPMDDDDADEMGEEPFEDDSVQGFFDHKEPVYCIDISPQNPCLVASGGGDDKGYLWRLDTGELLSELSGHTDSVVAIAFSSSGDYVATGGMEGSILVWKADSGEKVCELDGPDEVVWLGWHPRGNVLLAGASNGSVYMWAIPSGQLMNFFNGHSDPVTAGMFTPDGKGIVTVSEDQSLIAWNPKTAAATIRCKGREDARFHTEPITTVAVHPESALVLTGDANGSARLVNIHNGQIIAALENHSESIETSDFCQALSLAATGSVDGHISIWDVKTHRLRHKLSHDDAVVKIKFINNSPYLASCSVDKSVKFWDTRSGACLKTWKGHQAPILDMAVSCDGKHIVTASDDGACLVFRIE